MNLIKKLSLTFISLSALFFFSVGSSFACSLTPTPNSFNANTDNIISLDIHNDDPTNYNFAWLYSDNPAMSNPITWYGWNNNSGFGGTGPYYGYVVSPTQLQFQQENPLSVYNWNAGETRTVSFTLNSSTTTNLTLVAYNGCTDDSCIVSTCSTSLTAIQPPVVNTISVSTNPVQVNTAISATATLTDADTSDTHTASWNWGDGNTTTGTVTESNGSGSVSNTHTYAATGVYAITLTVTDNHGAPGTATYQYVAVYDSTTSFAGGRSFDNPATASPSTSGKVMFGISAKYNNSNVLTGSAKMNFKAASIDFASTSLTSLATSNGRAYLKGTGTVNGSSGYTFLATGIDGSVAGGSDLIRFQIKDSSNNVIYDSQPGAGDTTDPTTIDATGNIRVH